MVRVAGCVKHGMGVISYLTQHATRLFMKAKFIIPLLFLAAIIGFWVCLKVGHKNAVNVGVANPMAGNAFSLSNTRPANDEATSATVLSNKFLTLPEVEQALKELGGLARDQRWQRVQDIANAIDPAEIPAFMKKLAALPAGTQSMFSDVLLRRWGGI